MVAPIDRFRNAGDNGSGPADHEWTIATGDQPYVTKGYRAETAATMTYTTTGGDTTPVSLQAGEQVNVKIVSVSAITGTVKGFA